MNVTFMGFADIKNPYQRNKHVAKIKAIGQIKSVFSHYIRLIVIAYYIQIERFFRTNCG